MSKTLSKNTCQKPYNLFEVFGVEVEYMIVDQDSLEIKPIADLLFHDIAKKFTDEIERGQVTLNNELALHVMELKTTKPEKSFSGLDAVFQKEIASLQKFLKKHHAALLPGAMHPWMDPSLETRLWPHGDRAIYEAFHRIFDCKGHGFGNLQSAHLNLPFLGEEEFVKLHNAIRLVLPLIPTLAASSPFAEGKLTGFMDTRLKFYQTNCKRVLSVTGHVIPESSASIQEYQTKILDKIYKDMEPYDPEGILRYEWLNARGAIARFNRSAIEIRLVDVQEAPLMDIAILSCLSSLIETLVQKNVSGAFFDEARLKKILDAGINKGEEALLEESSYLEIFGWKAGAVSAKTFWRFLLETLIDIPEKERNLLELILKEGTLAARLIKKAGQTPSKDNLRMAYQGLRQSLESGEPFIP